MMFLVGVFGIAWVLVWLFYGRKRYIDEVDVFTITIASMIGSSLIVYLFILFLTGRR